MIGSNSVAETVSDLDRLKRLDRILTATSSEGRQRLATYLRRYMSPLLVEDLFEQEQLDTLTRETVIKPVTVIVADVRGFTPQTRLAERSGRGIRAVAELLEDFLNDATEAVFEYRGVMGEFLGDKFAAFFGIPFAQPDDADRAIMAAIDIYEAAVRQNRSQRLRRRHHIEFDIGIGICTGGPIWIGDIGAGWRRELSMIGTVIHAASRIEELTKDAGFASVPGYNILLTQSCLSALNDQVRDYLKLEAFPSRTLRGLGDEQYHLYKIVSTDERAQQKLPHLRVRIDSATRSDVDTIAQLVESIEEREDRSRLQQTMQDIGQAITSSLELDEILESVLDEVQRFLNATTASLLLIEEGTHRLRFRAVRPKEVMTSLRSFEDQLVIGKGIVGHVAKTGQPLILADAQEDPRFYSQPDKKTGFQTRSVLCAPIRIAESVVGVIQVIDSNPGKFFEEDLQTLESIAAFAASAIRNARQYERVAEAETLAAMSVVTSDIAHRLKNDVGLIQMTAAALKKRLGAGEAALDHLQAMLDGSDLEASVLRPQIESILADRQQVQRNLELIYQSARNTLEMMDEIRHPFTELNLEQVQLRDLLESALDAALAQADPQKPVEIVSNYVELPPLVTDRQRLIHVFHKVIENGIEAMTQSEKRVLGVDVWQPDASRVRVGISDTGEGIPAERREELFRPMRSSHDQEGEHRGWGYGLWSSRLFVRSIGGAISLDDVYSQGTRFIIDLPLAAHIPLGSGGPVVHTQEEDSDDGSP